MQSSHFRTAEEMKRSTAAAPTHATHSDASRRTSTFPIFGSKLRSTSKRETFGEARVRRVVLARDQQCRDFEPDIRLMLEISKCVEHGSELGRAQALVEMLREAFQVDVGRIHVPEELNPWLLANIAGTQ